MNHAETYPQTDELDRDFLSGRLTQREFDTRFLAILANHKRKAAGRDATQAA